MTVGANPDPRAEAPPTRDDAMLLTTVLSGTLYERALDGMELLWTYPNPPSYGDFTRDHPPGSTGYRDVMGLLSVGARLGTFVKRGVLHKGLTLDLIWMTGIWDRTQVIIADLRTDRSNPTLFGNLEALAKSQADEETSESGE